MLLLENKTALITGGSRGIGEAIVRAFVNQGAKVVLTYLHSEEKAHALIQELGKDKVRAIQCDGSDAVSVQVAVETAFKHLGQIDVLVNNAGITQDQLLLRMTEENWDKVIDVNLKSVFLFTKIVCKYMLRQGGSIISLSSVMGMDGNAGQTNYAASKAGVIGFTKSVAQEYGSRNIRCNAIAPGWIQTEMTAKASEEVQSEFEKSVSLNRVGQPQEVAEVAVFLGSDMSSYITGQVIRVCGGIKR